MKRGPLLLTNALLSVLALLGAATAHAADLPAYPFVSTSGKAQAWLPPDIGELRFETGAQHTDAGVAGATLAELSAAIAQVLAEHGIPDADIDSSDLAMKTVELSKPAADGAIRAHAVARHYAVRVRDLARWPGLVAAMLARDHVDSISASFDRTNSAQLDRDLMAQAAQDARANGALLAQSFGRQLGPATAIARGPLERVSAPFVATQPGHSRSAQAAPAAGSYAVPPSIPFAQSVTAIFRLQ
ncbi:SIMPL domain-containing protein [Pseudoduganella buxea]|uniref:DUF541 domain-containing protein n=1 Tax=Pseudoduganella buxea TaxID=1949069 RepID=A0A6I3SZC1_9BURK|nr:SIMPL domain-containing protein [Pseudoduganella buxea]MTV54444.1 DUF541 domain-containing protein [Pseudoduganella buxea]GGC05406.1 hypothetical protein GCM10011572_29130 [Pseudoduganella buxea]